MMRLCILLPVAFLCAAGCTSYRKSVSQHEIIDAKLDRGEFSFKHSQNFIETSIWQNKRIVVTDIEFYPYDGNPYDGNPYDGDPLTACKEVLDSGRACVPISGVVANPVDKPLKRIRHMVVEGIHEEQASARVAAFDRHLEVDRVQINEQKNIKQESKPVINSGLAYSFIAGVFIAFVVVLGLRRFL